MKELEKIKQISIATTLFILAIVIGLLTYERPKHVFKVGAKQTLEKIVSKDYFTSLEKISAKNSVLIDVRSPYEFEKGHLKNARNIPIAEMLNEENTPFFNQLKKADKTIVLYGNHPQQVNAPFIELYALGITNVKILAAEKSDVSRFFAMQNCTVETSKNNVAEFIKGTKIK